MAKRGEGQYLSGLDGLRAISIVGVICSHLAFIHAVRVAGPVQWVMERGFYGVSVFFVLSGFLITWLLLNEERRRGGISLKEFYVRRFFRIIPAAAVFLGVVLLLMGTGALPWYPKAVVTAALSVRNIFSGWPVITQHFWSLSVEEQFYLIWPLAFLVMRGRKRLVLAMTLIACLIVWKLWIGGRITESTRWRPDLHGDSLLCGCVLAMLRDDPWGAGFCRLVRRYAYGVLAAALGGIGLTLATASTAGKPMDLLTGPSWIAGLLGVTLLIQLLVNQDLPGLNAFLEIGLIAWVGRLSYSLYLWQQMFCINAAPQWWLSRFPQNVGATFVIAVASYYLIEQPALRFRSRLTQSRRDVPPRADHMPNRSAILSTSATLQACAQHPTERNGASGS